MKVLFRDWFNSTLTFPYASDKELKLFDLLPKDCYLQDELKELNPANWSRFIENLQLWIGSTIDDNYFVVGDYKIDLSSAQLNTGCLIGNDQVRLMARLHGQCEIHCYVEAINREWLATIIEKGLKSAIYRQEQGWESVIALLRNGCNTPVVTSCSVCEPFPNNYVANFEPVVDESGQKNWDAWYNLQPEKQWDLGMKGLRRSELLELKPQFWEDYYFSHGWDAFKINHLLTIPTSKWSKAARIFSESSLPATEAWRFMLNAISSPP